MRRRREHQQIGEPPEDCRDAKAAAAAAFAVEALDEQRFHLAAVSKTVGPRHQPQRETIEHARHLTSSPDA
jgi:hypothetical protein